MARDAAEAGERLKRRSPGVQARASDNVETVEVNNVMSNATAIPKENNARPATVDFHGQPLTVITAGDQRLVAMKSICDGIGLDWAAQFTRIKRDEVLHSTIVVTTTVAQDGKRRETVCLPLEYLNGWLFGVEVSRCREEIRPTLIRYKRECYAALAAYWNDGMAVRTHDRDTATVIDELIGMTEVNVIRGLIRDKAKVIPIDRRRGFQLAMHNRLHTRFNVPRVELIPAQQFDAACNFVAAYALEGEWLPKREVLTSREICDWSNINFMIACIEYCQERWEHYHLYTHLSGLGCKGGSEIASMLWDGLGSARHVKKHCAEQLALLDARLR